MEVSEDGGLGLFLNNGDYGGTMKVLVIAIGEI